MKKLHSILISLGLVMAAASAWATDVNVVGLTAGKAVVTVNGGRSRILRVGEATPEGVKLLSADSDKATLEIDGKRATLSLGQGISAISVRSNNPSASLPANGQGHFLGMGSINGVGTRFMVDTGASLISLSGAEARRIGLPFSQGQRGWMSTANGTVPVYRIVLNSVQIGDIVLNMVDAAVIEGSSPPVTLLGMSFLQRVEMTRNGDSLVLTKRY